MPALAVTKMHGTYNDFALLDGRRSAPDDVSELARLLCDRRGGLGADGLLLLRNSDRADVRVQIINADGSEAETCGNGMRCVARYLSEAGEGDRLQIETLGGLFSTEVLEKGPEFVVRVKMGVPHLERHALPIRDAFVVSLGNPHVVIFERALDAIDLISVAERLQSAFPNGTNVHVAVVVDAHRLDVRHWERGVGTTFACGSGAVAAAAAAIIAGLARSPIEVHVPGGVLQIEWDQTGSAYLTGPAVRVYDTQLEPSHVASV